MCTPVTHVLRVAGRVDVRFLWLLLAVLPLEATCPSRPNGVKDPCNCSVHAHTGPQPCAHTHPHAPNTTTRAVLH